MPQGCDRNNGARPLGLVGLRGPPTASTLLSLRPSSARRACQAWVARSAPATASIGGACGAALRRAPAAPLPGGARVGGMGLGDGTWGLGVRRRAPVAEAAAADEGLEAARSGVNWGAVAIFALLMLLGVANRVLYRIALVPMENHVFFLAQFQTFGYVVIYFAILFARARAGAVTSEMLSIPKRRFVFIGFFEAVSQLLAMVGASKLPGVMLPILNQSLIVWQFFWSSVLLGQRFGAEKLLGAGMVGAGASMAALASMGASAGSAMSADPFYIMVYTVAFALPSLAIIFKEQIFADAKKNLKGKELDLFVVNSFGSLSQAIWVCLSLPILTAIRNMRLADLPQYLLDGGKCFLGATPSCGTDCTGSPLLPILYVVANLAFNIVALYALRTFGGVLTVVGAAGIIPLTVFAFTLNLPLLGSSGTLGPAFLTGTALLVLGMLSYNGKELLPVVSKWLQGPNAAQQ